MQGQHSTYPPRFHFVKDQPVIKSHNLQCLREHMQNIASLRWGAQIPAQRSNPVKYKTKICRTYSANGFLPLMLLAREHCTQLLAEGGNPYPSTYPPMPYTLTPSCPSTLTLKCQALAYSRSARMLADVSKAAVIVLAMTPTGPVLIHPLQYRPSTPVTRPASSTTGSVDF